MSEKSKSSNQSKRLKGVVLLIIGLCLLVAQFLMSIISVQREKEAFAQEFDVIDEKINTVVAREVATTVMADAGPTQEFAVVEEVEPAFAVEPAFVFEPVVRTQFNVLGAFRIAGSLVTFIFLGVGIYVLRTRKEQKKMEDSQTDPQKSKTLSGVSSSVTGTNKKERES